MIGNFWAKRNLYFVFSASPPAQKSSRATEQKRERESCEKDFVSRSVSGMPYFAGRRGVLLRFWRASLQFVIGKSRVTEEDPLED